MSLDPLGAKQVTGTLGTTHGRWTPSQAVSGGLSSPPSRCTEVKSLLVCPEDVRPWYCLCVLHSHPTPGRRHPRPEPGTRLGWYRRVGGARVDRGVAWYIMGLLNKITDPGRGTGSDCWSGTSRREHKRVPLPSLLPHLRISRRHSHRGLRVGPNPCVHYRVPRVQDPSPWTPAPPSRT